MGWIVAAFVFLGHLAAGHMAERRRRREAVWTFLSLWAVAGAWAFFQAARLTGAEAGSFAQLFTYVVMPAILGLLAGAGLVVVRRQLRDF